MKIDLNGIFNSTERELSFKDNIKMSTFFSNKLVKNTVMISGTIYKIDEEIIVDINAKLVYTDSCARCLKDVENEVETHFTVMVAETEADLGEDELDSMVLYTDGELMLESLVEAMLTLEMPMKIVCEESCKGICTVCGVNRNEVDCSCKKENIDPRLEKLGNLFK